MIKSAHLINCQSHKDTRINFSSGVNVIVGDTDSGKSALMRGLRYALWNKLTSKSLISNWGGPLQVSVDVDKNKIIRKSDGKELYLLNDLEFNSFGTKVPEEIAKVVNMEEINSQEQIDSFFLLTETPGYVASYLNKIANLEQIDTTTKAIKSELNETNRLIEHQKEDLKKKEAELVSFNFLDQFKKELDEADSILSEITNISIEINVLKHLSTNIKECTDEIAMYDGLISLKPDVDKAIEFSWNATDVENKIQKIKKYSKSISAIDDEIDGLTSLVSLKTLINDSLDLIKQMNELGAKSDSLETIVFKLSGADTKIEILQSEIATDKDIYETELHKLGKCFFCGSKLK